MALGMQAFDGLLAGGAEFGRDDEAGIVEVLVGRYRALVFLAEQDGLAHDDVGIREVDLEVSLLGDGHAAHDDVELFGDQGRDDAVPCRVDDFELDAHGLGHFLGHIHVKADELAFFVRHFKGEVSGFQSDAKGSAFDDFFQGRFFCQFDVLAHRRRTDHSDCEKHDTADDQSSFHSLASFDCSDWWMFSNN